MTELEKLRNRKDELNYLKNLFFASEEEYKIYMSSNKEKFHELRNIERRIKEIEWQIKTPTQKRLKRLELLKLAEKFDEKRSYILHQKNYINTVDLLYEILGSKNGLDIDTIFSLTELLQLLESKPFQKINFIKKFTEEMKIILKTKHHVLFGYIEQLDF